MKLLDTLENGGKLDAFRHVYTMAYLSRYISIKNLRHLGEAHEKDNQLEFYKQQLEYGERPDSLACEMDLRNNELGFLIGQSQKGISINSLKDRVLLNINIGNAWYLIRNAQNIYITCQGEPINLNDYKNKWSVPKCLKKSNE
jgi:hypothetical protein